MDRDGGNIFVLEGIIISMILLGAAYAVHTLNASSIENARPRAELARLVDDALAVLAGLEDGNGTNVLDLHLLEAMHCAYDATPSTTDCQGTRSKNLSLKLDSYLPLGGGYAVSLGNGAAVLEIWRSPLPQGEAVAASRAFGPEWNTTFVFTEFSCYPAGVDVNLTLIPIDRAHTSWARWSNATVGSLEVEGKAAFTARWWNATLPAATRPAAADVRANTTGNATFPGMTSYASCDHGGLTTPLRDALKEVQLRAAAPSVPVGSTLSFEADITAILGVAGASVASANVTVYEPLPTRSNGPDTWLRAGDVVPLTGAAVRTGTWSAPSAALYGAHPVLLRVDVVVGGTHIELRRAMLIDVALASGEVPYDPPYRAVIQGWLADWG